MQQIFYRYYKLMCYLLPLSEEKYSTKSPYTQRSVHHPVMSEEVQKSVNLTVAALLDLHWYSLLIVSRSSSVKATYQNDLSEELLTFLEWDCIPEGFVSQPSHYVVSQVLFLPCLYRCGMWLVKSLFISHNSQDLLKQIRQDCSAKCHIQYRILYLRLLQLC